MSEKKRNYNIPLEKVRCKPMDPDWAARIKEASWWGSSNIKTPDMYLAEWPNATEEEKEWLKKRWKNFLALHDILLSIGGYETCFADNVEEDMEKILSRGQFYSGRSRMMVGKPNRCHENVCNLYQVNKDKFDIHIATGYALSDDGCWRQHSWLVHRYQTPTQHRTRIIETTVKRVAYFGFEMNEEEAEKFCYFNYY